MGRVAINLAFLVPLALWTGAAVGLTFLTTPAIFAILDRDTASRLVSSLFPGYFRFGLVCLGIALLAAWLAVRRTAPATGWARAVPVLLAAMIALMLYAGLILEPEIAAVQATIVSFVTETDSPARQEFRRLHGLSSILNLVIMTMTLAVWVATAWEPRFLGATGRPTDRRHPAPTLVGQEQSTNA